MLLKILRLTLHSDAPMRGDASKLRGFFATSFNEHALLHQHVTDWLIYKYPLIQYKMLQKRTLRFALAGSCGVFPGWGPGLSSRRRAMHPESHPLVEKMAQDLGIGIKDPMQK